MVVGIILILIDWAFFSIQHINSLEELTQEVGRRHHPSDAVVFGCVWYCKVTSIELLSPHDDFLRSITESQSFLNCILLEAGSQGKECAVCSHRRDTVSSHLTFLGPPHPCNLHPQFLRDSLAYFGMFSSFHFPMMVKIQNGKQLSHTGND